MWHCKCNISHHATLWFISVFESNQCAWNGIMQHIMEKTHSKFHTLNIYTNKTTKISRIPKMKKTFYLDRNKANLRDLIAATGPVILFKLDSNHRFFSHVTLKFDWWPQKIIGHLLHITSSFVHHLKSLSEFKLELQSGNAQFGSKSAIFCPVWPWNSMDDLENQ